MIYFVRGDLFESPAQVLVNTVNTVGVMGKGIALQFKKIYPEMFKEYRALCEEDRIEIGTLHLFKTPRKWILNFPTKKSWRQPSRPEYINAALSSFTKMYSAYGIHSIAFPPLGCGNGELDWDSQVEPLMQKHLGPLPIDVFIYPPQSAADLPEHRKQAETRKWLRSEPVSLPFLEVWDDLVIALQGNRNLKTISQRSPFRVTVVESPPSLRVETNSGRKIDIESDELLHYWQHLRQYGFSFRHTADDELRSTYLMPIFLLLSYVELVSISRSSSGLASNAGMAIQIKPPAQASRELFTESVG